MKSLITAPFVLGLALSFMVLSGCASPGPKKKEFTQKEKHALLLEVAAANLTEGDPTGALENLEQAKAIDPKVPELQYLFALAYFQKNEPALALQSAKKAVELRPTYSQAQNTLGKLLLDQGKFKEAEQHLMAAAKDLTFRDAYITKTNLGILYYKQMKLAEAERWLSGAIADGKASACMASYYRGQVYLEKNELEKAQHDFRIGSRGGCTQFADAHLAVGKTLVRMKKYDQARSKFLETKQLFPQSDAADKASTYLKEIP